MPTDDSSPEDAFSELLQRYRRTVDDQEPCNAEAALHEIFAAAAEWCEQNPAPAFDLTIVARRCEDNADWMGAEAVYQQVLSRPNLGPAAECMAHMDLAALYRLVNRRLDALRHARLGVAAARRTDIVTLLAMMLLREARYLVECDLVDVAGVVLAEALSVIEDGKMYDQQRASLLTLRAQCEFHHGRLADAERDLEVAFRLLQPLSCSEIAAGVHADLARWWSLTAKLSAARKDREGAVAAWQKAVQITKNVSLLPHASSVYTRVAVAEALDGLANALAACDRAESAAAARAESAAISKAVGIPHAVAD